MPGELPPEWHPPRYFEIQFVYQFLFFLLPLVTAENLLRLLVRSALVTGPPAVGLRPRGRDPGSLLAGCYKAGFALVSPDIYLFSTTYGVAKCCNIEASA